MNKIEYVAGFLFDDHRQRVLLIEKQRPEWQKGLFNGVGGKIEADETPIEAMRREFYEETGFAFRLWNHFATLQGEKDIRWKVHFFCGFDTHTLVSIKDDRRPTKTDERLFVFYLDQLRAGLAKTIPNLHWLIPMALSMNQESAESFIVEEIYK